MPKTAVATSTLEKWNPIKPEDFAKWLSHARTGSLREELANELEKHIFTHRMHVLVLPGGDEDHIRLQFRNNDDNLLYRAKLVLLYGDIYQGCWIEIETGKDKESDYLEFSLPQFKAFLPFSTMVSMQFDRFQFER
jgi:hypothetical protein